jgi:hypothetical protein
VYAEESHEELFFAPYTALPRGALRLTGSEPRAGRAARRRPLGSRQGALGRNVLRAFGFSQADAAPHRESPPYQVGCPRPAQLAAMLSF